MENLRQASISKLLKAANRLQKDPEQYSVLSKNAPKIRVAVIGSYSIQHFVKVFRLFLDRAGINAEIYEGEYGGINMDVLDENSPLYQFKPDFVVVFMRYNDVQLISKEDLDTEKAYLKSIWAHLDKIPGVTILNSNFAVPMERPFGTLECDYEHSSLSLYRELNLSMTKDHPKNVRIIDMEYLSSLYGKMNWFDEGNYYLSKQGFGLDYLGPVADEVTKMILPSVGVVRKCLVLDLDNTLWGGVVGDDGPMGIEIDPHNPIGEAYRAFQSYVLSLKRRGVILAVNSKNDLDVAKEPFEKIPDMVLKLSDIACFVANWQDKASNMAYIAKKLNIGMDSLVFFDDNPAEREIIRKFCPEVCVIDVPNEPENYVRALGIKGRKQWEDRFLRHMPRKFKSSSKDKDSEKELLLLEKLEGMREQISLCLKPLFENKKGKVSDITRALVQVIETENCKEKLDGYKEKFISLGNEKKAREYEQIYDKILNLLKQIDELLGDDEIDISEYRDILSAGFSEIEVGTIPQDVDRIIVGDIERTRLREVKVLFLLGVNDGYIPSGTGTGGILSDIDRQYLLELDTGVELAPTPRQQMYIQRLYLYMNLTKPTDRLFLSYAELGADGKSLRPAYLVPKLIQMFPGITVEKPEEGTFEGQLVTAEDSMDKISEMLRKYALGILEGREKSDFITLYRTLSKIDMENSRILNRITEAAFKHYEDKPLSRMIALSLYGANLENSVSRLELFARCCYAHFLKYGLRLEERKEYEFNAADLGNVFHEVLEKYTHEVMSGQKKWTDITKEESDELLNRILTECITGYGETILMSSARNQYMTERIKRILTRTVDTLKYQISKGHFEPAYVEMDFRDAGNIDEINITLSEDEKNNILTSMKLHGRIDRIDLCEDADHVYVKVIDFKSSGHKFNVAALYYGLQLQLVMYMNVATAAVKKKHGGKDIVPAAVLYYHVDDPLADGKENLQPDDINEAIKDKLRTTGLVNENMDVINLLDEGLNGKSDVIPVELKKDGSVSARSTTVTLDDYEAISKFVDSKIKYFGNRILQGEIKVNPYEMGDITSCTYCSYRSICGYDEKISGYSMRELNIKSDEAMELIRNQNN